jgi:hypothetical protein
MDQVIVNYCRLFLQVRTIADLATPQGTHMDLSLLQGHPSTSSKYEIHQERPSTTEAWSP